MIGCRGRDVISNDICDPVSLRFASNGKININPVGVIKQTLCIIIIFIILVFLIRNIIYFCLINYRCNKEKHNK